MFREAKDRAMLLQLLEAFSLDEIAVSNVAH